MSFDSAMLIRSSPGGEYVVLRPFSVGPLGGNGGLAHIIT